MTLQKIFLAHLLRLLSPFFQLGTPLSKLLQHKNTIDAQKVEAKRNTRIALFKEIGSLLDQSSSIIMNVNIYCRVKKYSNPQMKSEISHEEFLELMGKFSQALLPVVSKVESHEVVNLKLFRVFRFALQSIHYDFRAIQFEKNRFHVLEKVLELSSDAQMYFGDFQICMQNLAYGEVFDSSVPFRIPADTRYKVITNDPVELDKLYDYFSRESNWGKNCVQYENDALKQFASQKPA